MRCFVYTQFTTLAGRVLNYNPEHFKDGDFSWLENSSDFMEFTKDDIPFLRQALMKSHNLFDIRAAKNVLRFFGV